MTRTHLLLPCAASQAGWQNVKSAPALWDFHVANGSIHTVSVRLEGCALEFSAGPLAGRPARWDILLANRELPPPARTVLNWRGELQLRCEVALNGECADRTIRSALDSISAGLEATSTNESPLASSTEPWDAESAAADAGLAGRLLPDGRFRLDAGTATPRAATLGPGPVARVRMLPAGQYPAIVREAVATLLLGMTSGVRFARATADDDGSAWLEVRFTAPPSAGELQSAIAALALAARCTEELAVLNHEDAASLYLAAAGESMKEGGE